MIRYATVCSGIEAPSVAWHKLGWEPVFFSEIEPFPCAVLAHHYPGVPNLGDLNELARNPPEVGRVDVLCGGTPCQSFSVAGLRGGLRDPRGNLALAFVQLAHALRAKWVVWENVPGVLSSNGGRDFGSILGALAECGYGWAYRVLDAQHFGVPQRRRRIILVGCLGDWRSAAAVLFERESLRGDPAPRRAARKKASADPEGGADIGRLGTNAEGSVGITLTLPNIGRHINNQTPLVPQLSSTLQAGGNSTGGVRPPGTTVDTCESLIPQIAGTLGGSSQSGGFRTTDLDNSGAFIPVAFGGNNTKGPIDVATACRAKGGTGHGDFESETFLVEPTEPFSFKPSHFTRGKDGAPSEVFPPLTADADKGDQDPIVCAPMAFDETQVTHPENRSQPAPGKPCHTLAKENAAKATVAIAFSSKDSGADAGELAPTLRAGNHDRSHANGGAPPAVAYSVVPESGQGADLRASRVDTAPALTASNESKQLDRGVRVVQPMGELEECRAYAFEADAASMLSVLRREAGAEAFAEWGSRVLAALQSKEVLRAWLHGTSIRCASDAFRRWVDDCPLARAEGVPAGSVRVMWREGPDGRSPQGRGLAKQLAREFGAALPELSHSAAPQWRVRRLTVTETERLQGFPDGYTLVEFRGKPAADSPRYKAVGNSMAVPVMAWVAERIQMVEDFPY